MCQRRLCWRPWLIIEALVLGLNWLWPLEKIVQSWFFCCDSKTKDAYGCLAISWKRWPDQIRQLGLAYSLSALLLWNCLTMPIFARLVICMFYIQATGIKPRCGLYSKFADVQFYGTQSDTKLQRHRYIYTCHMVCLFTSQVTPVLIQQKNKNT